jgi:hypothetical protein
MEGGNSTGKCQEQKNAKLNHKGRSAAEPHPKKKNEPQSTQRSQSGMKKFFKIWIKTKI